jgi:hypothetical protein
MANRAYICGFEGGTGHYGTIANHAPTSTVTMFVSSTKARTGTYSLQIDAASGTANRLQITAGSNAGLDRSFFRSTSTSQVSQAVPLDTSGLSDND